ncbi:20850_t:CDS:2 [Gigaspora margarita]|uniref:20850_t:CDS:1 n=1 Tax=Gigaspora margarita TaxID=4874 RepID=A0ABN7UFW3_GIGMA|nr:20850_t:CDS:2 [Gigaspora margarita]
MDLDDDDKEYATKKMKTEEMFFDFDLLVPKTQFLPKDTTIKRQDTDMEIILDITVKSELELLHHVHLEATFTKSTYSTIILGKDTTSPNRAPR